MPIQPRISASFLTPGSVRIRILNYAQSDSGIVNIYKSEGYYSMPELLVAGHESDEYIDEDVDDEGIYKYIASFDDAPIEQSIDITAKPAGPPAIITFSPVGNTTVSIEQHTFPVSWGPDLELDILEISGLIAEWYNGNESIATGLNRTL